MKLRFLAREAGLLVVRLKSPELIEARRGVKDWLKRLRNKMVYYVFERVVSPAYFGDRLPLSPNLVAVLARK